MHSSHHHVVLGCEQFTMYCLNVYIFVIKKCDGGTELLNLHV